MPKDKKKRILWCKVARRADFGRPNNHYYCCEDHFNVSIYIILNELIIYFFHEQFCKYLLLIYLVNNFLNLNGQYTIYIIQIQLI